MIHVVETIRLAVPVDVAWARLADLEWLATINLVHQRVRFVTEQRRGVGTRLVVDHGLSRGPLIPRLIRITHWDEGRRIRWTDVDPDYPTFRFPHSEQFSLAPTSDGATVLTDELIGTLNVRLPLLGRLVDGIAQSVVVAPVVRRQCADLRGVIGQEDIDANVAIYGQER